MFCASPKYVTVAVVMSYKLKQGLKMKLYIGAREYRPEGFLTVDLDPTHNPDILCNAVNLKDFVGDGAADAVCASHILEHIEWPDAVLALAEWLRVLKVGAELRVAVPDFAGLSGEAIANGNPFHAIGLLWGIGGKNNPLERHRFAYTRPMLGLLFTLLGADKIRFWKHNMPDGSNGWMPSPLGARAISLNVAGLKLSEPLVPLTRIIEVLNASPLDGMLSLASEAGPTTAYWVSHAPTDGATVDIQFELIQAHQRIKFLESKL
jgi:predicted SAM-dependent methyltransferase